MPLNLYGGSFALHSSGGSAKSLLCMQDVLCFPLYCLLLVAVMFKSHLMTRSDSVLQLCFRCSAPSDKAALVHQMWLKWLLNAIWTQLTLGSCFLASSSCFSLSNPSKVTELKEVVMNSYQF